MKTPIFMDKTFKKRILSTKTPDSVDKNWFDTVLSTEIALFMDKIK